MLRALAAVLVLAGLIAAPARAEWRRDHIPAFGFYSPSPHTLWTLFVDEFVPPRHEGRRDLPIVLLLHGCSQDGRDYETLSGWPDLAAEKGFILLVADFNDFGHRCFGWGFQDQRRPATATQLDALTDAVRDTQARHGGDGRVFVAGLSAGGAMTVMALAMAPDVFTAGASVAGLPYDCSTLNRRTVDRWAGIGCALLPEMGRACACMAGLRDPDPGPAAWAAAVRTVADRDRARWPPLAILHGTADRTVDCSNAVELAEQWTGLWGGSLPPVRCRSVGANGDAALPAHPGGVWRLTDAQGGERGELRLVPGLGHAYPTGPGCGDADAGRHFQNVGLCAAREIWAFWTRVAPGADGGRTIR